MSQTDCTALRFFSLHKMRLITTTVPNLSVYSWQKEDFLGDGPSTKLVKVFQNFFLSISNDFLVLFDLETNSLRFSGKASGLCENFTFYSDVTLFCKILKIKSQNRKGRDETVWNTFFWNPEKDQTWETLFGLQTHRYPKISLRIRQTRYLPSQLQPVERHPIFKKLRDGFRIPKKMKNFWIKI